MKEGGGGVEQDSRSTKQGEQKHLREGQIPSPAPQIMVWNDIQLHKNKRSNF